MTAPANATVRTRTLYVLVGLNLIAILVAALSFVAARAEVMNTEDDIETLTGAVLSVRDEVDGVTERLDVAEGLAEELGLRVGGVEDDVESGDLSNAAASATQSVVTVLAGDGGLGSGFVAGTRAGESGPVSLIITNYHVVAANWLSEQFEIDVRHKSRDLTGVVTSVDEIVDLALIEVRGELPVLPVTTTRQDVGEPVVAVGSPLGLEASVSTGVVSAYRTDLGIDVLQFSAPISPGNSGGPVVNGEGEVVGVSVFKSVAFGAEGLSFAVPSSEICSKLKVCT